MKYANIWWSYAKKTGLEKEIREKFPSQSKIRRAKKLKKALGRLLEHLDKKQKITL